MLPITITGQLLDSIIQTVIIPFRLSQVVYYSKKLHVFNTLVHNNAQLCYLQNYTFFSKQRNFFLEFFD